MKPGWCARVAACWLLLACKDRVVAPPSPAPAVEISNPVAATLVGDSLELRGRGFGAPGGEAAILVESGTRQLSSGSTGPGVRLWQDDRIAFRLPADAGGGTIRVLQLLDRPSAIVRSIGIPKPPNPGPFATTIFGDQRTQISVLGEDLLVDPLGRVWLSQGGGYLYDGVHPNHSRIVSYEPGPGRFRIYNIPGDRNEVIGLAWDVARGRLWFAQGGTRAGAKLWSFDPERVPFDNTFDFSTSLDHLVNPPDPTIGYRVYTLPRPGVQPAHLAIDADGSVWYTAFFGNAVGRLVPSTGAVTEFPLPPAIGRSPQAAFAGGGPFAIAIAPDGAVVFSESFDNTVSRLDGARARAGDPACRSLDANRRNPCVRELVAPNADQVAELVHSIAFDAAGRLWYTQHGPDIAGNAASVGFVTADFSHIVRLPRLPRAAGEPARSAAGIAIHRSTGEIWFTEFWSKRIGRLRKVNSP